MLGDVSRGTFANDGRTVRTIEPVFESTARPQNGPLDLHGRQNSVQDRVDEDVADRGGERLPAEEPSHTILRPANLSLELIQRQRLGAQERRRRAAGDVIAAEGENVDEDRETEGDAKRAKTCDMLAMGPGRATRILQLTGRQTRSHAPGKESCEP